MTERTHCQACPCPGAGLTCLYVAIGHPFCERIAAEPGRWTGLVLELAHHRAKQPPAPVAPPPVRQLSKASPPTGGRWPDGPSRWVAERGDGRVAIIVPTYNRPQLIGRALRSIAAQTRGEWRCVVVHNGGKETDAYAKALAPFLADPRFTLLSAPNLSGIAVAANRGFAAAAPSEFGAILDDDDEWEPKFLEKLGTLLDSDRSIGIAYCDAVHVSDGGGRGTYNPYGYGYGYSYGYGIYSIPFPSGHSPQPPMVKSFFDAVSRGNWFGWSQALWRRELLAPDYLTPSALGCADWDAWLRISARSAAYHVPEQLATHHWHGGNASLNYFWMQPGVDWVKAGIAEGRYGLRIETKPAPEPVEPALPSPALPSWPRMAANFVGAQLAAAATGWQEVDAETKAARLAICRSCDRYRPSEVRCAECGCFLDDGIWGKGRASLAAMACPIGKWQAHMEMKNTNTNTYSGGKCGGCGSGS